MNFRQNRNPLPTPYSRYLVPFLAGIGLFLPVITRAQQPRPTPPAAGKPTTKPGQPKPAEHPKEDPKATKVFTDAIEQLKKRSSFEAALTERFDVNGVRMEMNGTIVSAPGDRLHAEIRFHQGEFSGRHTLISDGKTLWSIEQVGTMEATVTRVDLSRVREALKQPNLPKGVADVFFARRGFLGPLAVLETIHDLMMASKLKTGVDLDDHKVNMVTLFWAKPVEDELLKNRAYWMRVGVAGRMELYLDETTGWPYRIDWMASTPPRPLRKSLEIEFRDPKFSPTLSPEQQRAFTYDPGSAATVKDATDEAIKQIASIASELRAKQKTKKSPK